MGIDSTNWTGQPWSFCCKVFITRDMLPFIVYWWVFIQKPIRTEPTIIQSASACCIVQPHILGRKVRLVLHHWNDALALLLTDQTRLCHTETAEISLATTRGGSLPAILFDNEHLKFTQIFIRTPPATATPSVGSQDQISNRIGKMVVYSL